VSGHPHPPAGQPVGPPVDARPAERPGPVRLTGRFGRVEKLTSAHAATLWDAIKGHDALWTYMSQGPFTETDGFAAWVDGRAGLADPYGYAILDADDRCLGTASLLNINPAMRTIEVGFVVYSPALQRTPLATEAQYLLARYVFETLGFRRYEWKCDALNTGSRRAALRYGFTFEGIFRQHMIVKGRNRDTGWLSMLDGEWPARKAAFERWLAPDNFDADGRQRASLSAMNGAAG
jgi:RimJ/RimL family protein N-acetyltransferase